MHLNVLRVKGADLVDPVVDAHIVVSIEEESGFAAVERVGDILFVVERSVWGEWGLKLPHGGERGGPQGLKAGEKKEGQS